MKAMFIKVCKNHGFVKTEQGKSLFCYFKKGKISVEKYSPEVGEIVKGEIIKSKEGRTGLQFEIDERDILMRMAERYYQSWKITDNVDHYLKYQKCANKAIIY